jgi:hypothetical protein
MLTIKRKSKHKNKCTENLQLDEEVNEFQKKKKISKSSLEKLLSVLSRNIGETNDKQRTLESKVEVLGKQNSDFLYQNEQLLQEIINKSDYTKKLETLLFFILEILMPKQSFRPEHKNSLLSNAFSERGSNNNFQNGLILNNVNEFKQRYSGSNDARHAFIKSTAENLGENFLKTIFEKFKEHTMSKGDVIGKLNRDYPMLASSNSPQRNFNTILNSNNIHGFSEKIPQYTKDSTKNLFSVHNNNTPLFEVNKVNNINTNNMNMPANSFNTKNNLNQTNINTNFNNMPVPPSPKYQKDWRSLFEVDQSRMLDFTNSPNPFLEDPSIFNSPNRNDYNIIYKQINNNSGNEDEINMLPLSRHSSLDMIEFFKSNQINEEDKKHDNFLLYDNIFSISSNDDKSVNGKDKNFINRKDSM